LSVNSRYDGLLFAIGNKNSNNIVPTGVLADGSGWDLRVQSNVANFSETGTDAEFSFLYLSLDTTNLIGGRYDGYSNTHWASAGDFAMRRLDIGQYQLTIDGETPETGMLILTVSMERTSSSITAPDDNFLTYEDDGSGNFLIHSLDLTVSSTPNFQHTEFVWAFISFTDPITLAVPGDANSDGKVDDADAAILADHWGAVDASRSMGDFDDDGTVGPNDAAILAAHWGHGTGEASTAVPEPSTLGSLLALTLALLFRRRR